MAPPLPPSPWLEGFRALHSRDLFSLWLEGHGVVPRPLLTAPRLPPAHPLHLGHGMDMDKLGMSLSPLLVLHWRAKW